jgi:sensor domain CHASE-containing protein
MDEFERELQQAFERRPAPPGLKRKLMEKRGGCRPHHHAIVWQRLAAAIVLAAAIIGGVVWRNAEERRKGEAARQQVLTALRITSRALNQMNTQLAAHGRAAQE